MASTEPRILATVRDPEELRIRLCERFAEIGLSRQEIDRLANLDPGYAGKLLCDPPMRRPRLDTIFSLVAAAGCELVMVENSQAMEYVQRHAKKRNAHWDGSAAMGIRYARNLGKLRYARYDRASLVEAGRKGADARWAAQRKRRKTTLDRRRAALIRWARPRPFTNLRKSRKSVSSPKKR